MNKEFCHQILRKPFKSLDCYVKFCGWNLHCNINMMLCWDICQTAEATISTRNANVFGITRINNRDHNFVSRSLFSWLGYFIPFFALSEVTVFLNTEAARPPDIQTNLPPVVVATVLDGLQLPALSSLPQHHFSSTLCTSIDAVLQQTVWCRL